MIFDEKMETAWKQRFNGFAAVAKKLEPYVGNQISKHAEWSLKPLSSGKRRVE